MRDARNNGATGSRTSPSSPGSPSSPAGQHPHGEIPVDALFRSEAPRLTRFFRFRTSSGVDPLDLVQEAFARFIRRSSQGIPDNPAAYLHRIARNLLFEQYRRDKHRAMREVELDQAFEIAVPPPQSSRVEALQTANLFQKSFEQLPPRAREVFLLHRVDELSYKDIAERLEISVRTVEWHMSEALHRLRGMMDKQ